MIDHPDPPEDHHVPTMDSKIPVIVLLRRDWEFLFDPLRSSRAVVDYLFRVGGPTETLGTEPQRYHELAAADRDVVDAPLDPVWAAWSGRRESVPLLPAAPAGSDDDEAHAMVRFGVCTELTKVTRAAFRSWFPLRHHERSAVEPLGGPMSVGVLLTPTAPDSVNGTPQ